MYFVITKWSKNHVGYSSLRALSELAQNKKATDNSQIELEWLENESLEDLAIRMGILPEDLGEVFLNFNPVETDVIIPKNARISLFPRGMHLLCGGQHMKGHGFITTKGKKTNYWCDDQE